MLPPGGGTRGPAGADCQAPGRHPGLRRHQGGVQPRERARGGGDGCGDGWAVQRCWPGCPLLPPAPPAHPPASHTLAPVPHATSPPQLRNNASTRLSAGPNGAPRIVHGLEGFEKKGIIAYLKECPVRADQRASKPAKQPVPHAIVVNRVYEQCQVGTGGRGRGGQARPAAPALLAWLTTPACAHALARA